MLVDVGMVEAMFRYPVKSMAGEALAAADLGWHGLAADRRLALRRTADRSGSPWLTARALPELLRFVPVQRGAEAAAEFPTHVRSPEGEELPAFGEELASEIGRRCGTPVQMMRLNHGIFDAASVSLISTATVEQIGKLAGKDLDLRRFRPNLVVRLLRALPFQEDEWVGGVLHFGEGAAAAEVTVTKRDSRCMIVNLDPGTAHSAPEVLKAVVGAQQGCAGVYGTVTRTGRIAVGQTVCLRQEGRR